MRSDASAGFLEGRYRRAEMNRGAVPAAAGGKIFDQRAVAFPDPPVLAIVASHPLVAQRKRAEAARVGCIVTLDGSRDRAAHFLVFPVSEMRLQKVGDGQVGCH